MSPDRGSNARWHPGRGAAAAAVALVLAAVGVSSLILADVASSLTPAPQRPVSQEDPTLDGLEGVPAVDAMGELLDAAARSWEQKGEVLPGAQALAYAGCELPLEPVLARTTRYLIDGEPTPLDLAVMPAGTGAWALEGCQDATVDRPAPQTLSAGDTTLMRYGDVLLTVATTDPATLSALDVIARQALHACADITSGPEQVVRAPLSPKYTGQTGSMSSSAVVIETPTPAEGETDYGLPAPALTLAQVTIPPQPDYPVWPELPTPVAKPVAPTAPERPEGSYTWPTYAPDTVGPGCGWAFTMSAAPDVPPEELAQRTKAAKAEAERAWQASIDAFDADVRAYWAQYAAYVQKVQAWDEYASQVAEVLAQWKPIQQAWDAYQAAQRTYEADLAAYEAALADREKVRTEWEEKVARCEAQPTPSPSPWYPTPVDPTPAPTSTPTPIPTPTPTPLPLPTTPKECRDLSKPAVLDAPEPVAPTAPTPPPDPRPQEGAD